MPGDRIATYFHLNGSQIGCIDFPADMTLEVERPDPDAELIQAMAEAVLLSDALGRSWSEIGEALKDNYRGNARAALAAYRENEARS